MSTDKPGGGNRPDHTPKPEHKPFPGQPENRPHVPPPTGTRTPEQVRAERKQHKTTSDHPDAQATAKTTTQQAPEDTATRPAGTSPGTPGTAVPGTRSRVGTVPGGTPARDGNGGGQHPATPHDRGAAARLGGSVTRRPDGLARLDSSRLRPFPCQPENRPHVPPPTGSRTPEQVRAQRKQHKTTSDHPDAQATAKTPQQAAARDTAPARQGTAPKEAAASGSGTAANAERSANSRDQGRTGVGRGRENAAARENAEPGTGEKTTTARTVPSGTREQAPAAEAPASHRAAYGAHGEPGHGSDHHPGQPGQHEGTSTARQGSGPETGHSPGKPGPAHDAGAAPRPDTPASQRPTDDRPPTEGTLGPHLSWTTIPPEARTIGDTAPAGIGRKPDGEHLMEPADNLSRADAFRRKSYEAETIEDVNDIIHEDVEWIDKLFDRPPSSSRADVPVHHPLYEPAQTEHANTTDIVMASLVATALVAEAGRAAGHGVHNLKEKTHEMIERSRHAGD